MKKGLLALVIALALVWSYGTVFAKGKNKGRGTGAEGKRTEKVQRKDKGRQADVDEPGEQDKEKQEREREQRKILRKKQEKIREMIRKARARSKTGRDANKPPSTIKGVREPDQAAEGDIGKGKGHRQQLEALKKQMLHENAKHLQRVARLNRIRELAAEENSTKVVEGVDKLLEREQRRYDRKWQRMQERQQKVPPLTKKSLSDEAQKVIKKGDDKTKAKTQNRGKGKSKSTSKEAEE